MPTTDRLLIEPLGPRAEMAKITGGTGPYATATMD